MILSYNYKNTGIYLASYILYARLGKLDYYVFVTRIASDSLLESVMIFMCNAFNIIVIIGQYIIFFVCKPL